MKPIVSIYGRPRPGTKTYERKQKERAARVFLPWGKGTRPLSANTINKTLEAMRLEPERREMIIEALLSTVRPGIEYTGTKL